MAYEILKGVPKPPSPVNQYNFDKMEVNDMLAVPIEDGEDHQKKLIVGVWRIA
jgi:hypothetical protein